MMKTQATAVAKTNELASFTIPARVRSLAAKTLIAAMATALVMSVAYFGFAINLGGRAATAAEHVMNTAQHTMQSNFQSPYINYYGFKSLSPAQQRVYADVYRAAYLTRDTVTVNDMTEAEISEIMRVVWNDSPELFYLNPEVTVETTTITTAAERNVATVHLSYSLDKNDVPEARESFENTLAETASIASNCQSDANKVHMIQGWVQQNAVAPTANKADAASSEADRQAEAPRATTAYDVLMNGETSEAGNAQLFNALCSEVGVEAHTVAADEAPAASENATNAVMLGKDWRYVDLASESNALLA